MSIGHSMGRPVLCVLLASCLAQAQTAQPVHLAVDPSVTHQTITGFGTALAGLSPVWTTQMQDLFTQDLGASMLRVPLLPDLLPTPITMGPDVQANVNLFNYNTYPLNSWGQFSAQVTAKKLDQMKVIGTVFTPPAWMKTNDSQNGGSLIQDPGNLQQFARYLAAYVTGFQQQYGVPLYAISLQNELRFAQPYPSAYYNPPMYVATLKAVGDEFGRDGITTRIFGPEDVGVDSGYLTNNQMNFINAVKADPVANQYLNILAVHGYSGNGSTPSSSAANWADYYNRIKSDPRESWMTETSGENPAWIHTDPSTHRADGAVTVALNMHEGLAYGNLNAWVYWQFDDGKFPVSPFVLTEGGDPTSLKYNAAKHYMRYIRPGAVRVDAGPDNPNGVSIDAWVDDADHTLTINLINMSASDTPATIAVPGTDFASFAEYLTTAKQPWAVLPDVANINGILSLTLPGQSVITLYSNGIGGALPEPALGAALLVGLALLWPLRRNGQCTKMHHILTIAHDAFIK